MQLSCGAVLSTTADTCRCMNVSIYTYYLFSATHMPTCTCVLWFLSLRSLCPCISDGVFITCIYCCRFADLGAKVVLWDVNKKGNEAVAEEIRMKNQQAYAYQCDLSKREDIYRVAAQVSDMYM